MDGSICSFTVRPPSKGVYHLIMYAKDTSEQQTTDSSFSGIGEYDIICVQEQAASRPFPPCVHTSWGPGDSFSLYQLQPHHRGAVVMADGGTAEIRIAMDEDLRFTGKLKAVGESEDNIGRYLMTRIIGKEAIFVVKAPYAGEFGLEIYANNPTVDGHTLHHVYQYLIICDERYLGKVEPFPLLTSGYLGPQSSFHELGLSVAGVNDPFVLADNNGYANISFAITNPVRMSSQLIYVREDGQTSDCSDYVLQQSEDNLITFVVRMAQEGMFKLQIYALAMDDPSENLPGVYNALIHCRMYLPGLLAYPKQYSPWKNGCHLFEPLDGLIESVRPVQEAASSPKHVYFRLQVPGATSVMVVIGEEWFPLEEERSSIWSGEVLMEPFWGNESKATLCVSFDDPAESYSSLLEYALVLRK